MAKNKDISDAQSKDAEPVEVVFTPLSVSVASAEVAASVMHEQHTVETTLSLLTNCKWQYPFGKKK